MANAKHTAGPWTLEGFTDLEARPLRGWISDSSGRVLVWLKPDGDEQESMSNARLIAAAPDLLAELIEVRNIIPYSRSNGIIAECRHCEGGAVSVEGGKRIPHTENCLISRIDAAIAKATGTTP